ncbi:SET domain-containing protein, partial [Lyophyllum atratum]
ADLVKTVYQRTWDDFYVWEQDHCLRTLHSLARSLPQEIPQTEQSISRLRSSSSDTDSESFTIMDYTHGGREPRTTTVSAKVVDITRHIESCAAYEACTPTNRNINVGDDSEYMPFIPLIDDPKFNFLLHAGDYKYFDWQVQNRNPDLQVILKQTVHTLHDNHKLSLQDIDETGVLPQPVLSNIVPASRRRDFPEWPEISSPLPYMPSHANAGPSKTLSNLVNDFCNNANCVIGYCTVHLGDMPLPEAIPPTISTNALADSVNSPCGAQCFLLGKAPAMGTFWSAEDVETLTTILSFSPDLLPCDLATICRKPCQEVFKHRGRLFPDSIFTKVNDKVTKSRPARPLAHQFQDHDAASFTPNWPCSHPGPCDNNCPCFANDAHCERSCRCDRKCLRRWRGCQCAKSKQQVNFRLERLTLCLPSYLRDASSDICKNACIQRGIPKRTEVRQSAWGLGLYIAEEAKEEEFVIEYTGELVYEVTSICRDSKAGNESRFINHDPKNANCHAGVRLVNGEHRIGLFTLSAMSPGTELLLNYGDSFFQRDGDAAPEGEGAPKGPTPSLEQVVYALDQHSSDETYSD